MTEQYIYDSEDKDDSYTTMTKRLTEILYRKTVKFVSVDHDRENLAVVIEFDDGTFLRVKCDWMYGAKVYKEEA